MTRLLFILFLLTGINGCKQDEKPFIKKEVTPISPNKKQPIVTPRFYLYKFLSLDSVSNSDYYFDGPEIDSITIDRFKFNAIYLECYKAHVQIDNYSFLQKRDYSEYQSISAIHTRHSVLVDGKKVSFNGKGSIGCRAVPESTLVSIDSKLYSLYSDYNLFGRLIILESITPIK